jgi:uncharacterized iron-regulated membrane protein
MKLNLPEALTWIVIGLGFVLLPVMMVWLVIISACIIGVSVYMYWQKRKREAVWEGETHGHKRAD